MYQKVFNMLIIKRQLLARDHTRLYAAMAREAFDDNNYCRVRVFRNTQRGGGAGGRGSATKLNKTARIFSGKSEIDTEGRIIKIKYMSIRIIHYA